jgi:hypothetical protein
MHRVFQTKYGGSGAPKEQRGNCIAACLASIFELPLDAVPDFAESLPKGEWLQELDLWLGTRGLYPILIDLSKSNTDYRPSGYHLTSTNSPRLEKDNPQDGHMVVGLNGRIVHNPNKYDKRGPDEFKVLDFILFGVLDVSAVHPMEGDD